MQKCTTNELNFTSVNRGKVVAVFDDPQVTSDAGTLVLRLGKTPTEIISVLKQLVR